MNPAQPALTGEQKEYFMKVPISVIIIAKDPKTMHEIHHRFDLMTNFPRLRLLSLTLGLLFGRKLSA